MKRLIRLSALGICLLLSLPSTSKAFWNSPQDRHGFGWWEGCALKWGAFIHIHGPLYSYGPYCGQGYANMYVPQPYFGAYHPAYPAAYYNTPNPYATMNGFLSWNGTGVQLGYPNALNAPPTPYFNDAVLRPQAKPLTSTSNYYGSAPAPGYFRQLAPSEIP